MDVLLPILLTCVLILIVVSAVLIFLTVLTQLRWRLPFVPTPMPIVRSMVEIASLRPGEHVVDLGAGDARLLLSALRTVPRITAEGYELAYGVWLLARMKVWCSGRRVSVYRRSLFSADLRTADVIFVYLLPHILRDLLPKFRAELRPGTRVVSHAFSIPGLTPTQEVAVPMRFGGMTKVRFYVW